MVCRICGLAIAPSAIVGRNIHVPVDSREVMRALKCPSYGAAEPEVVEEDIPAIWRSEGHWNAMWARSK